MARGKTRDKITSITEAAAAKFMQSAEPGATLFCKRIPNFHLIRQNKKGAWRLRYRDATGRLRTATVGKFPDMMPEEAAAQAKEWKDSDADPLRDKAEGRQARRQAYIAADRRTLGVYLEGAYQAHMKSWKPANVASNNGRLRRHFAEFMDRDMATLCKQDMRAWQARMVAEGRPHDTIRRCWASLRAMLNQAAEDEVLPVNPLRGYRLQAPAYEDQERSDSVASARKAQRRMLTPVEMQSILTGLDLFAEEIRAQRRNTRSHGKPDLPDLDLVTYPHWFIPYCRLALATGMAPSDLNTLDWSEVDLRFSGRISKQREKAKGPAIRRGSDPAMIEAPLPESAKKMLSEWHKQQEKPDIGLVFASPRTGRQMAATAHNKPWARVKALGGLDPKLHFYAIRHHVISAMIAGGVPLLTVAKLVGHKDAVMIQKHYGHLCPDSAATAMDVVSATIEKAEERRAAR